MEICDFPCLEDGSEDIEEPSSLEVMIESSKFSATTVLEGIPYIMRMLSMIDGNVEVSSGDGDLTVILVVDQYGSSCVPRSKRDKRD